MHVDLSVLGKDGETHTFPRIDENLADLWATNPVRQLMQNQDVASVEVNYMDGRRAVWQASS